jgi:hypothetical protein
MHEVNNINSYLTSGRNVIVNQRLKPLSSRPKMITGNSPYENNFLRFYVKEKDQLLSDYPNSKQFIRKLYGTDEFLKGIDKWCLWISDENKDIALEIPPIKERIMQTREFRLAGGDVARGISNKPHQFRYTHTAKKSQIIIPIVSSERREYIPIGYLDSDPVIISSAAAIYDPELYVFGILSSKMHMCWVRITAGRLENRLRYLSALCYNTFPFPNISELNKSTIEDHAFKVMEERERHSEKTMAQLYDPDKMPAGLRQAHHELDMAVEQCYRSRTFKSDEERLEYLFNLYEEMIEAEKREGGK